MEPGITILVHRVDLFDSGHSEEDRPPPQHSTQGNLARLSQPCGAFSFENSQPHQGQKMTVSSIRIPAQTHPSPVSQRVSQFPLVDTSVPNPHGPSVDKYWTQRRRLFSLFDNGIKLDEEGWFSVTPEQIADHVALRMCELVVTNIPPPFPGAMPPPIVVLDAFCGCGGNAIAMAKQPNLLVYACDVDRSKLRMAAQNAAIYQIPPEKLVFIECNVLFILEFCYRNGSYILDQPIDSPEKATALMNSMPPPVPCEKCMGYTIGGIDMLPRGVDAVFMDPPWGGVDYEVFGKHGYDLKSNMMIKRPTNAPASKGDLGDDFFDSFATQPRSRKEKRSQFNCGLDESNCVNGAELLALAAAATARRWVIFDVPRNTNQNGLGEAALAAGYRGNCKLEEHYLNGRLKTVTAYFGTEWSGLLSAAVANCRMNGGG